MVSEVLAWEDWNQAFLWRTWVEIVDIYLQIWHGSKDDMGKNRLILAGEVLHRWNEKESGAKKSKLCWGNAKINLDGNITHTKTMRKVDLILQSLNDPDVASMQVCKYALLQWPPEQAYPSTVTKFPAVSLVTIGCSALTLKHQIYLFLFFFDQIHLFLYFSAKYICWLSTFISLCRINRMFLHCIDLFENLLSFNSCAHCVVFWK